MVVRRTTYIVAVEVDETATFGPAVLDTVERSLDKLKRKLNGLVGISAVFGIIHDEGKPQGDYDQTEADDTMG